MVETVLCHCGVTVFVVVVSRRQSPSLVVVGVVSMRSGFVSNNRGIDNDKDLPSSLLENMFDAIKNEEIHMDEGDLYESQLVTYMGARKAGWLEKRNFSKFHRLWFVLNDGHLPGSHKGHCREFERCP